MPLPRSAGFQLACFSPPASCHAPLTFTVLLDPCNISLDISAWLPDSHEEDLHLTYAYTDSVGHNNGNVQRVNNNLDMERTQLFTYDSLNRLATAETLHQNQPWWNGDSPTLNCWGEQFNYDPWGNLLGISPVSSAYTGCTQENWSMTATTKNQLQDTNNDYVYDAQGRLVHTENPNGGNGWRADVYAGNRHLATYTDDNPVFHHTDWLGTLRNDDFPNSNAPQYPWNENFTSLPFGDWIDGTLGIPWDESPLIFTGQYHDFETDLDYFGARYYASAHGRFMSADPENAGSSDDDPQSWNAYSYVLNNPLNLTDLDGLDPNDCKNDPDHCVVVTGYPLPAPFVTVFQHPNILQKFGDAASRANDYLRAAYDAAVNSRVGCIAAATAAGAIAAGLPLAKGGSMLGAGVGAVAGFGAFDEVTIPAGSAIGGGLLGGYGAIKGGQLGYALGTAACSVGTGGGGAGGGGGGGRRWKFGSNKSASKWASQLKQRGWTEAQIDEAIEHGQQYPAPNNINPANGATRFVNPTTGQSVVLDNVTGEVLHVGGPGFKY